MEITSNIAPLRESVGLTQSDLAKILRVTESTVANWEKGRSSLDWIERVIVMCRLFKCSPEDLIIYQPEKKKGKSTVDKLISLDEIRAELYGKSIASQKNTARHVKG